jgi:hypothetical protein
MAVVNLGAAYLPGLLYIIFTDPSMLGGYGWALAAVAPVVLVVVKVLMSLPCGVSPAPVFVGAAVVSIVVILIITRHGVSRKEQGKPVWHIPVLMLVVSAWQALGFLF